VIIGKNTNFVYFSNLLQTDKRFFAACSRIIYILDKYGIKSKFLHSTKDIWCRDYLPIQVDRGKFVQFRYEPLYLKEDLEHQSDTITVCKDNNINPIFSKINLDGGNVVNWSDKAIVTNRIFLENPEYPDKSKLIAEIENLLEVELIVIPQINTDITGHADGMVRFLDKSTLIGNSLNQEFIYWRKGMTKILRDHNIEYIDIPFFEHKDKKYPESALGIYVNFLEIGQLILLPIFEINGNHDKEVIDLFKDLYPDRIIEPININEIGVFGGLLNCISWTLLE
jgi:agmatine deiminase